jgi:hypothetical protein
MLPQLARAVNLSEEGGYLDSLRNELQSLADAEDLGFLDLSESERFACRYSDFFDAHHAYPGCYAKALEASQFD